MTCAQAIEHHEETRKEQIVPATATHVKEIYLTLSRFPRTIAQEKSTHAGGIASRVTMRPLELSKIKLIIVADADADADAKEYCAAHNRHKGEKRKPWRFQAMPMCDK